MCFFAIFNFFNPFWLFFNGFTIVICLLIYSKNYLLTFRRPNKSDLSKRDLAKQGNTINTPRCSNDHKNILKKCLNGDFELNFSIQQPKRNLYIEKINCNGKRDFIAFRKILFLDRSLLNYKDSQNITSSQSCILRLIKNIDI